MYERSAAARCARLAGLVWPLVLVSACAGVAPSTPQATKSSEPSVTRIVIAIEPPAIEANNPRQICCNDHHQLRPVYENLIGMDPTTGKLIPQLATEWAIEPDGRSVRFKLRRGVKFHGDKWGEFSGRDVVHTWQTLTENQDSHTRGPWWKQIVQGIDVVNDHEIVFRLVPEATFFNAASELYGQLLIRSKAQFDAEGDTTTLDRPAPAGTGPYQYKERVPGTSIVLERVPYQHWRVNGDFPEVELRWIREPSSRLAALLAGEVHITKLPSDLIPQAESRGMNVIRSQVPGTRVFGSWWCCWMDQNGSWPTNPESPLLDVRVRRALNVALDREELRKAFVPVGESMVLNHFHPRMSAWDSSWEQRFTDQYGHDPAKARALLSEAGYGSERPLKIDVHLGNILQVATANDLAEGIANQWRKVGVDATLQQVDPTTETNVRRALKYDRSFKITGTAGDQLQGIGVYNTSLTNPPGTGFFTPEIVNKFKQISGELDAPQREPLVREIGEMGFSQFWDVPLWFVPVEAIVNPSVVSEWVFPGSVHSTWTHTENIKAVRQ